MTNEDHTDAVRDAAGGDFDRLFVGPLVLEWTDGPDGSGKLLGMRVEMKSEEE